MKENAETGAGSSPLIAVLALSSLLLPAALLLLAASGGAPGAGFVRTDAARLWALAAGMFSGGFGLCTAPLGLPLVLQWLFVPRRAALFVSGGLASALAASAALVWLAARAWLRLPPAQTLVGKDGDWLLALPALVLAAGMAVRLLLEFGRFRRRLLLGKVSLDREEAFCAPGEQACAFLNSEKKPVSVSAVLKLYGAEADELSSREAEVGAAVAAAAGWSYRLAWTVPKGMTVPPGGGWELVVEVRGRGGSSFIDSIAVKVPA